MFLIHFFPFASFSSSLVVMFFCKSIYSMFACLLDVNFVLTWGRRMDQTELYGKSHTPGRRARYFKHRLHEMVSQSVRVNQQRQKRQQTNGNEIYFWALLFSGVRQDIHSVSSSNPSLMNMRIHLLFVVVFDLADPFCWTELFYDIPKDLHMNGTIVMETSSACYFYFILQIFKKCDIPSLMENIELSWLASRGNKNGKLSSLTAIEINKYFHALTTKN